MQFLMIQENTFGGLRWQFEFDMASKTMAIEFATRHAMVEQIDVSLFIRQFAEWRPVATITTKTETTAHVHQEPYVS